MHISMRFRDEIFLTLTAALGVISTYFALVASPAEVEMGDYVRILYFHLPTAIICYVSLGISLVAGIAFLWKKNEKFDALSSSAAMIGIVYGAVTLVTGAVWAKVTWGVYWNWDPRETTTLILWLGYLGYFLLRMSIDNPERRSSISAVYNVIVFLTVPLSYLSFILWPSLHPSLTSGGGLGLTTIMVETLVMNAVVGILFYVWMIRTAYENSLRNTLSNDSERGNN